MADMNDERAPEAAPQPDALPTATPEAAAPNLEAKLQALEAQYVEARQESAQLRNYLVGLTAQLQTQAAAALAPDPGEHKAKLREQFEQDPEAVLDNLLAQRIGPLVREQALSQAQLAKAEAVRQLDAEGWGEEYRSLAPKIDAFMVDVPADRQTSPEAWRMAFALQMFQGGQFDDVAMRRATKRLERERQQAVEGASPARTGPKGPPPLSEAEKRMARACGMSDAEWQEQLTALAGPPGE